jgi:hypothetical protein
MGTVEQLAPNEKRCSKCKEVKDKGEFGIKKLHKDGLDFICKKCRRERDAVSKNKKTLGSGEDYLNCPLCPYVFKNLKSHLVQKHQIVERDYQKLGITKVYSNSYLTNLSEGCKIPHFTARRGEVAEIRKTTISFPREYWPPDCKFAKVTISRITNQIEFNPINKKLYGAKSIGIPPSGPFGHRLWVHIHKDLLENLELFDGTLTRLVLRKGAGFVIQLLNEDATLLDIFEAWAKTHRLRNKSHLSIICGNKPYLSIASYLWPVNAEYAFLEFSKTKYNSYLDVFPVSRTGFIVGPKKMDFKQYIGLENCLKLQKTCGRLRMIAINFTRNNNIPPSDWDIKEILPSGALRFRLYKGRPAESFTGNLLYGISPSSIEVYSDGNKLEAILVEKSTK